MESKRYTQIMTQQKIPSTKERIEAKHKDSGKDQAKDQAKDSADDFVHNIIDYNYDQMDDHNKKAADVMKTQGLDAAIQHMFTDQETGRQLTYGEMRARYG